MKTIGYILLGALLGYIVAVLIGAFVLIGTSTTVRGSVGLAGIIIGAAVALVRQRRNPPKGARP